MIRKITSSHFIKPNGAIVMITNSLSPHLCLFITQSTGLNDFALVQSAQPTLEPWCAWQASFLTTLFFDPVLLFSWPNPCLPLIVHQAYSV